MFLKDCVLSRPYVYIIFHKMYGSHSQYQKYIFLCHVLTDSVASLLFMITNQKLKYKWNRMLLEQAPCDSLRVSLLLSKLSYYVPFCPGYSKACCSWLFSCCCGLTAFLFLSLCLFFSFGGSCSLRFAQKTSLFAFAWERTASWWNQNLEV